MVLNISKNEDEYTDFMVIISIILLIAGTIILISSALGVIEFFTSGLVIGLLIVFTGLVAFIYTLIFK